MLNTPEWMPKIAMHHASADQYIQSVTVFEKRRGGVNVEKLELAEITNMRQQLEEYCEFLDE